MPDPDFNKKKSYTFTHSSVINEASTVLIGTHNTYQAHPDRKVQITLFVKKNRLKLGKIHIF